MAKEAIQRWVEQKYSSRVCDATETRGNNGLMGHLACIQT